LHPSGVTEMLQYELRSYVLTVTAISNSSQISSTQESGTTDNDTKKSIINSIEERMSIRED